MTTQNGGTVKALEHEMRTQEDLRDARVGMIAHTVVTLVVWTILVAVNLIFVPEFLWVVFPIIGMSIGLVLHYTFGVYLVGRRARLAA